ncbi:MAG: PIN domain-containing protein [Desulfuromonadales bacterium]
MQDRPVFLDSNVFIYAYSSSDPQKSDIARRVIGSGNIIVSSQVINEFVSVTHRKLHHSIESIETAVREFLQYIHVVPLTLETSLLALRLAKEHQFSWYDCLIIAAARENNCSLIISEDLQHGRVIEDALTIINPFRNE